MRASGRARGTSEAVHVLQEEDSTSDESEMQGDLEDMDERY